MSKKLKTIFTDYLDYDSMEDYRKDLAEANECDINSITDDDVYQAMYDNIDIDWDNIKYDLKQYEKKYPNAKYVVSGSLGLWDGRHEIFPKEFDSLYDAVIACHGNNSTENFEILEDSYGKMLVNYSHHDGTNCFVIKKKQNGRQVNVKFIKEIYGYSA